MDVGVFKRSKGVKNQEERKTTICRGKEKRARREEAGGAAKGATGLSQT